MQAQTFVLATVFLNPSSTSVGLGALTNGLATEFTHNFSPNRNNPFWCHSLRSEPIWIKQQLNIPGRGGRRQNPSKKKKKKILLYFM